MLLYIPFENTRAFFCFSWTIDENMDNVHLIERFDFEWTNHTLGSGIWVTA